MTINKYYKELVFTNHALDRLNERKIDKSEAWATWRRPEKKYYAATKQAWVFQKNYKHRQIEVVATQNDQKDWVVLSVWSNYVAFKPKRSTLYKLIRWFKRVILKKC